MILWKMVFLLRGFVMIMKTDKIFVYMTDSPLPDEAVEGRKGFMTVIRKDAERSLVNRVLTRMIYALFMDKKE